MKDKLIKAFRDKGLAQHTTTIDSDGRPHGSGTFLILGSEHKTWDEIKEIMGWIQ